MTGTAILDADMATVARWLREGFDWWQSELAQLVPPGLRGRLSTRAATIAQQGDDGSFTFRRNGAVVPRPASSGPLPVTLVVPASQCLTRTLTLPAMGAGDLRRLVELDSDRLLPFPPGAAVIDIEVGARDAVGGRQEVVVAALPRDRAQAAIAAATAAQLEPRALSVAAALPGQPARFDFLPLLRSDGAWSASADARVRWWGAVLLLIAVNLGALVLRDVQATNALDELVEAHGETAATARGLRQRIVADDARRAAQLRARSTAEPLDLLAQLTRAMPDSSWVQRLELADGRLRLVGYQAQREPVAAALHAVPRFARVQAAPSELAGGPASAAPFDVTVVLSAK
jgi:general secretion pathway protein L